MVRTLAAVDAGPSAPEVAQAARALGAALGAPVDVVHVEERGSPTAEELELRIGGPVRFLDGDPVAQLLEAAADEEVVVVAVGAGHRASRRPIGHVAHALLERAAVPVLVVPRRQRRALATPPRHVLVPLDGTTATTVRVLPLVDQLASAGSDVTVTHVFDGAPAPAFVDHPAHQLEAWGREFLARYGRTDAALLLRRGVPWREVLECVEEIEAQLLVLGWSQQLTTGHAAVVRGALDHGGVAVLLVPVDPAGEPSVGRAGARLRA